MLILKIGWKTQGKRQFHGSSSRFPCFQAGSWSGVELDGVRQRMNSGGNRPILGNNIFQTHCRPLGLHPETNLPSRSILMA